MKLRSLNISNAAPAEILIYCTLVLFTLALAGRADLAAAADSIEINAYAQPSTVEAGESFEYTVELTGSRMTMPSPTVNFPQAFRIVTGPNSSVNVQLVNSKVTSSRTVSWTLIPRLPGTYVIQGPEVKHKKKVQRGPDVTVEVTGSAGNVSKGLASGQDEPQTSNNKGSTHIRIEERGNPDLFLEAEVEPREVYLQQPVNVAFTLYFKEDVRTFDVQGLPSTDGFWSETLEVPNPPQVAKRLINGTDYRSAAIYKLLLYPTRTGELSIGPMDLICEVQKRGRRRRQGSLFDRFFDSYEMVQREVVSPEIKVKVKPLPDRNRPDDFDGSVGEYRIAAKLDRDTVATNESVTLTVTISGSGNIGFLPEPEVNIPPDIERYDPEVKERTQPVGGKLHGKKSFTYLLIPRRAGLQKIAPVSFSYFNPKTARYVTDKTRPLNLQVTPASGWAVAGTITPGGSPEEVLSLAKDIRWIHDATIGLRKTGLPNYRKAIYPLAYLAPLFMTVFVVLVHRRLEKLDGDVAGKRSRRAAKQVFAALKEARQKYETGNIGEGFDALARGMVRYLADRTHNEPSTLDEQRIDTILEYRGIPEEQRTRLHDILNTCNTARFTPGGLESGALGEVINRAKEWIQLVDRKLESKRL